MAVDELGLANVNKGVFWLLSHRMIDFEHSFGPSPMPEPTFIRPSGQSTYDKLARHSALSHWQRRQQRRRRWRWSLFMFGGGYKSSIQGVSL